MKKPKVGITQGIIFGLGIGTSYGLLSGEIFLSIGTGALVGLVVGLLFPEDFKK
ncbi:MAG: hypothetical protein DDT36_01750 [Firmicutes bacterium]|nr:hypothetical protein [Bacillota bacterium]